MTVILPTFSDDGFVTPEIGAWGEEKYRLVNLYAQMFSASMKRKWECRVYIDLFAGAGRSRITGTSRIVPASPLVALMVEPQFDKYIFCDNDSDNILALKERIRRHNANVETICLPMDVNTRTDEILKEIPRARSGYKVLTFCFVDPFNLKDLAFQTIERLSLRFVDFLVLIASDMDATRNVFTYESIENKTVERFLGDPAWRTEWQQVKSQGVPFGIYLVKRFCKKMEEIGYLPSDVEDMKHVRSTDRNLPLYHLAFFSKHELALKLWKQAMKYSEDQIDLPW